MCCEECLAMLDELFNKTLAPGGKKGLEAHLAVCGECRAEFQKLKIADDLLRDIVSGMFSEIEVPPELSHRIEKALKGEGQKSVRSPRPGWLPALLRASAVAASLLLFIAAGTFGYRYIFSPPWKQSEIVWQEPAAGGGQKPAVTPGAAGTGAGPEINGAKEAGPEPAPVIPREPAAAPESAGSRNLLPENGLEHPGREDAPPGMGGGGMTVPVPGVSDRQRGGASISGDTGQAADSPELEGSPPVESSGSEEKLLFAAGAPPAMAENDGTRGPAEDNFIRKARESAAQELVPAYLKPDYLPPGAELQDVTQVSGTIYQNYRVGQLSMQISQSPAGIPGVRTGPASRKTGEVEINGVRGTLTEKEPGTGNGTSNREITITWQQDGLLLSVGGELPREELVKVASSLK